MQLKLNTNKGAITIELDTEHAPISSENFLGYAEAGDYDGTKRFVGSIEEHVCSPLM